MKQITWMFSFVFTLFSLNCGEAKKQDVKKEEAAEKKEVSESTETTEKSETTMDDLVYEGVGVSVLKMESTARSQAELKGRVDIIKALTHDAVLLMREFSVIQKDLFAGDLDTAAFAKGIIEYFGKESIQLKGSSVSEYKRSQKEDTTFAYMEMPLMAGYDVIETAVVTVGTKSHYLKEGAEESFKKNFHEFFMAEKKKLLTIPS
ncbi:hypothetical protein F9K33_11300 [bacterium]|nr:MAG: hypothetical protein F9K33_11300 [bacterium]